MRAKTWNIPRFWYNSKGVKEVGILRSLQAFKLLAILSRPVNMLGGRFENLGIHPGRMQFNNLHKMTPSHKQDISKGNEVTKSFSRVGWSCSNFNWLWCRLVFSSSALSSVSKFSWEIESSIDVVDKEERDVSESLLIRVSNVDIFERSFIELFFF